MTVGTFLHRQAAALEHLLGYRVDLESRPEQPGRTALDSFTIALSRQAGTPARETVEAVRQQLGWPVHDRSVADRIADELHLPAALIEEIDERPHSWLLECLASFCSQKEVSESRYFRSLLTVVRSLGEAGRSILLDHAAAFILPARSTVRVRLVGEHRQRIANLARSLHLDHETAAHRVEAIDHERTRFIREHFHVHPHEADHYDLVLNTSQWSPTDCADFIVEALLHKANGRQTS